MCGRTPGTCSRGSWTRGGEDASARELRALARCDVTVPTFPDGLWGALRARGPGLEPREYLHNAYLHGAHLHNPLPVRTRVGSAEII